MALNRKIQKLIKLGMSKKEAMLFVREIAFEWFEEGGSGYTSRPVSTFLGTAMQITAGEPFDTRFSKMLSHKPKK